MFYASQHQVVNEQQDINEITFFEGRLPHNMVLHSTFVYVDDGYFQCLWEADNIDMIQQYIKTKLGDECHSDYYIIDPITTIA